MLSKLTYNYYKLKYIKRKSFRIIIKLTKIYLFLYKLYKNKNEKYQILPLYIILFCFYAA